MISKKINLNDVEYIVRARTLVQLNDAIERIYNCDPVISRLSDELNQSLDNVLESQLGEPEAAITAEPAIETRAELPKAVQSTERQTPPLKKAPAKSKTAGKTLAKKVDPSIVDLGNISKAK